MHGASVDDIVGVAGTNTRFLKLAVTSGIIHAGELADALILLLAGFYRNRLSFMGKTGFASGAVPIARVLIRSYRRDPKSRAVRTVAGEGRDNL
jgi:hypothetical protein